MGNRERRRRREAEAIQEEGTGVLAQLVTEHRALGVSIDAEIERLVAGRVGWPAIAEVLGMSRQGARQAWLRRQEGRGT
jgi:hypothetical protein